MNSACPSCGAVYVLAPRHIGRRKTCKKCQAALLVTESGLKLDQPADGAKPRDWGGAARRDAAVDLGRRLVAHVDPKGLAARAGGAHALLFGVGLFLVVFTGFQDAIGKAKVERRAAQYGEGKADHEREVEAINANKDLKETDKAERVRKEVERWEKEGRALKAAQAATAFAHQQSGYTDKYALMLGFMLLGFGCVGYLRTESALLLRVVAGVILTGMVLGLFRVAVGAGIGAGVSIG